MAYDYLGAVKEFHEKYEHYISNEPKNEYPLEIVHLRQKLIAEESEEFHEASYLGSTNGETIAVSLVAIADALADLLYVVFGAALAYGIPIEEVFREVHRSNMTKSMLKDEKSIKGKTIKGPNYEPPNLVKILYPLK